MQFYSASFLGDMREVVEHVTKRYPKANVYAVGWSLGGNILVNYLGQVNLKQCILISIILLTLLIGCLLKSHGMKGIRF